MTRREAAPDYPVPAQGEPLARRPARPVGNTIPTNKAGAKGAAPRSRAATSAISTPNTILDVALRIFARDGFDGASMPAIAKAAEIGHPLIHYHFGSKENLWKAAADHAFADLIDRLSVLDDDSSALQPIDALRMLCRGFAQFTARHPSHALIILNEVRIGGERFDWLVERYLRPLHARLDGVIEAAVSAGQLRPIPSANLASIFVGATTHFFGAAALISRLYGVDVHHPDQIEAHANWVLDALMHGLAVPGGAAAPPSAVS